MSEKRRLQALEVKANPLLKKRKENKVNRESKKLSRAELGQGEVSPVTGYR